MFESYGIFILKEEKMKCFYEPDEIIKGLQKVLNIIFSGIPYEDSSVVNIVALYIEALKMDKSSYDFFNQHSQLFKDILSNISIKNESSFERLFFALYNLDFLYPGIDFFDKFNENKKAWTTERLKMFYCFIRGGESLSVIVDTLIDNKKITIQEFKKMIVQMGPMYEFYFAPLFYAAIGKKFLTDAEYSDETYAYHITLCIKSIMNARAFPNNPGDFIREVFVNDGVEVETLRQKYQVFKEIKVEDDYERFDNLYSYLEAVLLAKPNQNKEVPYLEELPF